MTPPMDVISCQWVNGPNGTRILVFVPKEPPKPEYDVDIKHADVA